MGGEAPFKCENKEQVLENIEIKPTLNFESNKPDYEPSLVGIALGLLGIGLLGDNK